MTFQAFGLILLGTLLSGLAGIRNKQVQNGEAFWKERTHVFVAIYMLFASLLCFGVSAFTGGPQLSEGWWYPVLITGFVNIAIMYFHARALAVEEASLVVPIAATTPTIVIVFSFLILGEWPNLLGRIGIFVMAFGTYLLNIQELRKKFSERAEQEVPPFWNFARAKYEAGILLAPFFALGKSHGVKLALLCAVLGAFTLNYDGLVARRANVSFGLGCVVLIVAAGNLAMATLRKQLRGLRFSPKLAFGPLSLAAIWVASNVLINYSYRDSIVPYVGTLKRLQIPFAIILAFFILKEKKGFKERLVGGIIMAVGVTLILVS